MTAAAAAARAQAEADAEAAEARAKADAEAVAKVKARAEAEAAAEQERLEAKAKAVVEAAAKAKAGAEAAARAKADADADALAAKAMADAEADVKARAEALTAAKAAEATQSKSPATVLPSGPQPGGDLYSGIRVLKHHPIFGSYERLLDISDNTLHTVDPQTPRVTNIYPMNDVHLLNTDNDGRVRLRVPSRIFCGQPEVLVLSPIDPNEYNRLLEMVRDAKNGGGRAARRGLWAGARRAYKS